MIYAALACLAIRTHARREWDIIYTLQTQGCKLWLPSTIKFNLRGRDFNWSSAFWLTKHAARTCVSHTVNMLQPQAFYHLHSVVQVSVPSAMPALQQQDAVLSFHAPCFMLRPHGCISGKLLNGAAMLSCSQLSAGVKGKERDEITLKSLFDIGQYSGPSSTVPHMLT